MVGAEGCGGESSGIVKIGSLGVVVPGVADGGGGGDFGAVDYYGVAFDGGFGFDEVAV